MDSINLKDFKDYCKSATREYFIKNNFIGKNNNTEILIDDFRYLCPSFLGVNCKNNNITCEECWLKALNNINFKDEKSKVK